MQQDLKVQKQGKKGAALMRYSDEVIEEVRARNDVVDVIGGYFHHRFQFATSFCPHIKKSSIYILDFYFTMFFYFFQYS